MRSGWKTATLVAGSVAGVAALSFVTFAIVGTVDVHDLSGSCSPHCSPSSVERANRELMAADVSLGIGVAALALATFLYLEWRALKPPAAGPRANPTRLGFSF